MLQKLSIEAQIDAAIKHQPNIDAVEPRANKVIYDDSRFILYSDNGASFSFLTESVEEIATLPKRSLRKVKED